MFINRISKRLYINFFLGDDRRRSYVHENSTGTSIENSRISLSQMKYPSHIAYYGINNNSSQLQPMDAYIPTQHPTVYSNFHPSPPMIDNGNRENGVELMYQTNNMYSFVLVRNIQSPIQ